MMGSAQHGHMAAIGYDLYCRMLEDTIKIVKGEIEREPVETTVDLKVDAFIPSSYIKDEIQKIEVYKKIAAIENEEDYEYVREELEDRFSNIPNTVYNLMDIAYIKSKAKLLNIEEIKEKNPDFVFVGITSPLKEYLVEYFQEFGNNCVFMGVGGSFDVISGKIPRAPLWMQKMNLEWFFRVIQEPRRLFKRYFIGNVIFIKDIIEVPGKTVPV